MKIAARPGHGLPRPLPVLEPLRDMLGELLGRSVEVDKAPSCNVERLSYVGLYVVADETTVAGVAADLSFAAYSAAALAMVPLAGANMQVEAGQLDSTFTACFYEVANVLSRLFNGESVSHLKLSELVRASDERAKALFQGTSKAFDVYVDGYGHGRLELYATG